MKNKNKGFSMLELAITMTLIVIITVMAVPNFRGLQSKSDFDQEVSNIFQLISDARANALAQKACDNGVESSLWIVEFDTTDLLKAYSLICKSIDDAEIAEENEFSFHTGFLVDPSIDPITNGGGTASYTKGRIIFFTDTFRAKITGDGTGIDNLRIFFQHLTVENGEVKAICFDKIQAFPSLYKEVDTGTFDCLAP